MLRLALIPLLLLLPAFAVAAPINLEDVGRWHAAQIASAGQGQRAIVRIPMVHRSASWGCVCPDWYIGDSADTNSAGVWLEPSFAEGAADLPGKVEEAGIEVIVEGYYTGDSELMVWEAGGEVRETYRMAGFHVLRWRPTRAGEPAAIEVLLDGHKAKEAVKPLRDDRPWLVIAHSLQLSSPTCTEGAEIRRKFLIEKGFKDTEVIDSRAAPLLSCCFKTVLLGRYKTRSEAKAVEAAAKAKKITTYVRRGW